MKRNCFQAAKFPFPSTVSPENHGEILMTNFEKKEEIQLEQQIRQEQPLPAHTKNSKLSGKQLVLRRGLLLLGVLLVLLAGILVRVCIKIQWCVWEGLAFTCPDPENGLLGAILHSCKKGVPAQPTDWPPAGFPRTFNSFPSLTHISIPLFSLAEYKSVW